MNKFKVFLAVGFLLVINAVALLQTALVKSKEANLRGTPTLSGKIVKRLAKGTSLEIIKQKRAWFLVQSPEYAGWIHGDTIALSDKNAVVEELPDRSGMGNSTAPKSKDSTRTYIRGSRGGCYYLNSNGNKTYVSRSLCN